MSIIPSMDTQVCAENSHNILCSITKDAENVAALDAIGIGDATDSSGDETAASACPLELIYKFIAELSDDKQALSSCSLVNRIWMLVCRDHLFSTIRIPWGTIQRGILSELLQSPLCTFVSSIRGIEVEGYTYPKEVIWLLLRNKSFSKGSIRKLSVNADIQEYTSRFDPSLIATFPNVTTLTVKHFAVEEDMRFIASFSHLEDLSLEFAGSFRAVEFPTGISLPVTVRKVTLDLLDSERALRYLLKDPQMKRLETLRMLFHFSELESVQEFLNANKDTLRHLTLEMERGLWKEGLDLSSLTSLESLRLVKLKTRTISLLRSATSLRRLTELNLSFRVGPSAQFPLPLTFVGMASELDQIKTLNVTLYGRFGEKIAVRAREALAKWVDRGVVVNVLYAPTELSIRSE